MANLEDHIQRQLVSTEGQMALHDHRRLVEQRWKMLKFFVDKDTPWSPGCAVSPPTRKCKVEFYGDAVTDQVLKTFKKKAQGLRQALSNASIRLDEVQREECHSCCIALFFLQAAGCVSMFLAWSLGLAIYSKVLILTLSQTQMGKKKMVTRQAQVTSFILMCRTCQLIIR